MNNDYKTPKIIALIPAYNEASEIDVVVLESRRHLPVLVVDDGSKDDTATVAEGAGAVVLRQSPNQGKGVALRAGFRWALDKSYQAVLTLDGDGQHDPQEIPKFLEAYQRQQADLIIGERDFSQIPPARRLANTLGRLSFSWALGQHIPDNQSGYRLISHRLIEALLDSDEHGFEFEVEMIAICVRERYTLAWVPIQTIYSGESSHINPLHHVRNFTRMVLKTRRGK